MNRPPTMSTTPNPSRKKRILLVDTNQPKQALRAKIMRKLGVDVDCASDTIAARTFWRPDSYNLVLMDLRDTPERAAEFCAEIKTESPGQMVAFYVGKPAYLASSPGPAWVDPEEGNPFHNEEMVTMLLARACGPPRVRGGFLEAVWRISATRSLKDPRAKRMPERKSVNGDRPQLSFGDAVRHAQITQQVGP